MLSNAVKFSAPRERPAIDVDGRVAGGEVVYRVRDNGVGFDMNYVDKLFGVFHRLHGHHEFEGTGVGLALAKRIGTRHGGRIWAEGELGRGATFSFALPVR
jgi:light-regulated signal transduction histidine kinase (bacteriophytochrome)